VSNPIRIGIVGAGGNSGGHLEACMTTGAAKPIAICDIIKERAENRQSQYQIERAYVDYREMLEKEDIDAVVVSVPNNIHHEISIAALKAGRHVLCEKPMSIKREWAEEMVSTAQETGKLLQVGMCARFRPTIQWLRKHIEDGHLGRVYMARAQYVRRSGIPGWGGWFTRKEMSGGGPLIDIGVHVLDSAWYLMGCPNPVSVCGATFSELGHRKMGLGSWGRAEWDGFFDVEDFATALIRMDNGAVISLEAGWAGYTAATHTINLMGSEQGASLEDNKVALMSQKDDHDIDTMVNMPDRGRVSVFARQMEAFAKAVRGEGPCMTPGEHGLTVTKMLVGIYESAAKGAEVRI
jgi:predicted dehydrogenase